MLAVRQAFLTLILFLPLIGACASQPETGSDAGDRGTAEATDAADAPALHEQQEVSDQPVVLFLGDSLSAGYGLPEAEAFPSLVQEKIKEAGLSFRVMNAGVSGDTSAGGLRRVNWLLRQPVAVLFLELGGNDGLRGVDLEDTRENLQEIIDRFRAENPEMDVVVAGMMIPPNLGPEYTTSFRTIFPDLAEANGATLIPFLLEGVAGDPELNMPDGIHPTAEGHRIVADLVWKHLEPVLQSRARE